VLGAQVQSLAHDQEVIVLQDDLQQALSYLPSLFPPKGGGQVVPELVEQELRHLKAAGRQGAELCAVLTSQVRVRIDLGSLV
jgi:hypothetical protein